MGTAAARADRSADPVLRWLARDARRLPADGGRLSEAEAAEHARMRHVKRRRDFELARWTAKQALATLPGCDLDPVRLEVRRHPSGAPEAWADGRALPVGISLSDRAGRAVCLLGLWPGAVGCDLELVEPRSPAFVRLYFTAAERRFVGDDDLRANLLWSAKESVLKVLRTGLRRDTRTVEVAVSTEGSGWSPLIARVDRARTFTGWWARYDDFLLTVATAAPTPPPACIDDPFEAFSPDPHVPSPAPARR